MSEQTSIPVPVAPESGACGRPGLRERFWRKVDSTDSCWLWSGYLNSYGYGLIRGRGKRLLAHRVAYELLVGPIPEGLHIDHLCRVRHCVNPAHMEPVTPAENTRRGIGGKQRGAQLRAKTHCPRGHAYSGDNLRIANDGRRHCRACERLRAERRAAERKAAHA